MEVAVRFDVSDNGNQRVWVDQVFKRLVVQIELTGNADHHAIEVLFGQGSKRSDAQLATKHHVEGMRFGATRFVTELQAFYLSFLASFFLVGFGDECRKNLVQVDFRN